MQISKTPEQLNLKYHIHDFAMLITHTDNVQRFKDTVLKQA